MRLIPFLFNMGGMSRIHRYEGEDIIVEFDLARCIHTGDCTRGLPAVFDTKRSGRWVHPDGAPATEVARICAACPTGALRCISKANGQLMDAPPAENTIQPVADGPLYVHGVMRVNGKALNTFRAAFCRCGRSRLMPWCDNSHRQSHFHDNGEIPYPPAPAAANRSAPLEIHVDADGPLMVEGPFTLLDATGNKQYCGDKAAFCRCGASAMKPYCDGTHRTRGFGRDQ